MNLSMYTEADETISDVPKVMKIEIAWNYAYVVSHFPLMVFYVLLL